VLLIKYFKGRSLLAIDKVLGIWENGWIMIYFVVVNGAEFVLHVLII
jgi:hypothetical protein